MLFWLHCCRSSLLDCPGSAGWFSLGPVTWFQLSESLTGLNVQDRQFMWLAVDAACWLGAYPGLLIGEPAHCLCTGLGLLMAGGWVPNGEDPRALKRKEVKTARSVKSVCLELVQHHSYTSAIFYWSKESQGPPRIKRVGKINSKS